MKIALAFIFAVSLSAACGGSHVTADAKYVGQYDATILMPASALFPVEIITTGTLTVANEANTGATTQVTGTFLWGQSSWNDPKCISLAPPPGCQPDKTGIDGRHGSFTGTIDGHGCVRFVLRTPAYPAFMSEERWHGRVIQSAGGGISLDFHSGGVLCHETVIGFGLGGEAQAWADKQ